MLAIYILDGLSEAIVLLGSIYYNSVIIQVRWGLPINKQYYNEAKMIDEVVFNSDKLQPPTKVNYYNVIIHSSFFYLKIISVRQLNLLVLWC